MGLAKAREHLVVPALRIRIFLMHEGDAAKTAHESGHKVAVRKVTFYSHPLLAIAVEEKHRRRPHRVKAVEPRRMLLDMGFYRDKLLLNELSSFLIFIRLGIQPSTSASNRGRAEVQENGLPLLFGCD